MGVWGCLGVSRFLLTMLYNAVNYKKQIGGEGMNKGLIALFLGLFLLASVHVSICEERRIYNDGVIDYVPLTASFVLDAWDSESSLENIQYSVDGSPIQKYTGPLSFSKEGRHVIVYRAVDTIGNISNERIYSVITDATPPEGLVTVKGPVFIEDGTFYLTVGSEVVVWGEDNLSGVDMVWIKIDDGEYMAYTGPIVLEEEGYHTARSYAVDNVGNRSATYKVSGYVDSSPPEVEILSRDTFVVVNNENYTNRANEYRVVAKDEIVGTEKLWVSLDDNDWVAYSGPFKVQSQGFHSLRAKAGDSLGNVSDPVGITFYVDIAPPETTLGTAIEQ